MGDRRGFDDTTTSLAPKIAGGATSTRTFRITVIEGPDAGATLTVDESRPAPALIGQSPVCDLRLSDRQTSRRHAAVDVIGARLHLLDLDSTNGTVVNDVVVKDAFLRGGEIVRVGATAFRVDLEPHARVVELAHGSSFGRVIGASQEMRRVYPLCARLAQADVSVVIEGETGTGKELLAESLHEEGPRANGPFVVFDCTTVPPNLVESELFGHERGAFTGAESTRKGVFELAHGGTLLIDEIGDLDIALQPKLLRALERSEIRRVGGDRPMRVDVRILSATRRDLDREVQAGRFRDDLFHRLAVVRLELPPLRARRGDIRLLAKNIAQKLGGTDAVLPEEILAKWEDYAWPGNVRELRNTVLRYLALGEIEPGGDGRMSNAGGGYDPLPPSPNNLPSNPAYGTNAANAIAPREGALEEVLREGLPYSAARRRVLQAFERAYVERVLAEHGGNVLRAAAASGIARRHLQRVKARHPR